MGITDQILQNAAHWFELADSKLDAEDCPLWKRPLRASLFISEYGIERTYDKSIKEYEYILIGNLLNAARAWYYSRYGEEQCRAERDTIEGAVLFRKIPTGLTIPLVRKTAADDGHVWLQFLTKFSDGETTSEFLHARLPVESLSPKARSAFESSIKTTVSLTRFICTSLRMVNLADDKRREMCHSIVDRLNIGAGLVQQSNSRTRAMAIWEFFFAIELSLKTYIFQKGEIPEQTHSLTELEKTARILGLVAPLAHLSGLPASHQAIQHRYAQRGATVAEVMRVYKSTLSVTSEIVAELKLHINGENPSLLLKKNPGWIFPPM